MTIISTGCLIGLFGFADEGDKALFADILDHDIEDGDDNEAQEGGGDHTAADGRTERMAAGSTGARSKNQRQDTEYKG